MLSDHLVLPILLSKDLHASRDFCNGTLGLEILREDEGGRIVLRRGSPSQNVLAVIQPKG